jgi:ubiquinone/menaquinone biosynthesis C-methylase UbiE
MIQGVHDMREAYRSTDVAENYVANRFVEPLGALLHARQVFAMRTVIRDVRPDRVLEIAPGPARLTADLKPYLPKGGVIVDASRQMLGEARRRLEDNRWTAVQGDAFALPFDGPFDLAYTFRLIRHFDGADRRRIYREIARVLRPGGVLVFDAVNEVVSAPIRARSNEREHQHYDALLRPEEIRRELSDSGFEVLSLQGVQHQYPSLLKIQVLVAPRSRSLARGLMEMVDVVGGGEPLEWVVVCRRR